VHLTQHFNRCAGTCIGVITEGRRYDRLPLFAPASIFIGHTLHVRSSRLEMLVLTVPLSLMSELVDSFPQFLHAYPIMADKMWILFEFFCSFSSYWMFLCDVSITRYKHYNLFAVMQVFLT